MDKYIGDVHSKSVLNYDYLHDNKLTTLKSEMNLTSRHDVNHGQQTPNSTN